MLERMGAVRKGCRLARLIVVAGLAVTAPGGARAQSTSWHRLCRGLSEFAGRVTDYRNQGRSLQEAVGVAFPELRVTTDHVVASEIAQQVFATPGLGREQEIATIFTKCMTPAVDQTRSEPQSKGLVTDLVAIPLQPGPNRVTRFAADGRDADITLAWRDEGSGHGRDIFLITMPSKDGTGWRSVDLLQDGASASSGLIADDPHRGDDTLRSLRFARGKVEGQDATLLLIATRSKPDSSAASDAVYEVYRLVQIDGRDGFARIARHVLAGGYCNADMALSVASGLPLRSSYRGPRDANSGFTKDGCPAPQSFAGQAPPVAVDRTTLSTTGATGPSRQQRDNLSQQLSEWNGGQSAREAR